LTGGPPTAGSIDEQDEWELIAAPVQDAFYPPRQIQVQHGIPAVADTGPFNLQYFLNFLMTGPNHQQHNAALKWCRDTTETAGDQQFQFDTTGSYWVPAVVHGKGEEYDFDIEGDGKQWRWQEMVAHMDERSMQMVLQGLPSEDTLLANWADAGGHHITGCRIQNCQSYDVKRTAAAKKHAAKMMRQGAAVAAYDLGTTAGQFAELGIASVEAKQIWDFVLVRNDGSEVFLHPNWKGGKITCFLVDAASCTPPPDPELPRSGQTGPFWYFKDKAATHTLRFDTRKTPTAKAKAKATVHPPQAKAKAEGSA
jgi:hypothetical protein